MVLLSTFFGFAPDVILVTANGRQFSARLTFFNLNVQIDYIRIYIQVMHIYKLILNSKIYFARKKTYKQKKINHEII